MKIWIDDVRPAPEYYVICHSVNEAIKQIKIAEREKAFAKDQGLPNRVKYWTIEVIDIDHDAGEYVDDGGDYIKLLDWLEETERNYPIRIHSMNTVGIENMRRIIQRNSWTEIK